MEIISSVRGKDKEHIKHFLLGGAMEKKQREGWSARCFAVINTLVREGFTENVTVEQRSEGGERMSTVDMGLRKSVPGWGNGKCKAWRCKHTWQAQMVWLECREQGKRPKK